MKSLEQLEQEKKVFFCTKNKRKMMLKSCVLMQENIDEFVDCINCKEGEENKKQWEIINKEKKGMVSKKKTEKEIKIVNSSKKPLPGKQSPTIKGGKKLTLVVQGEENDILIDDFFSYCETQDRTPSQQVRHMIKQVIKEWRG